MYKCKYFKLYELLPEELYKDENTGWGLFDEKLLITADKIREVLGVPCVVNNWKSGGTRRYSCLRTKKSSYYAEGSYHSLRSDRKVMAIDMIPQGMTAAMAREKIMKHKDDMPFQMRLENNVTWIHADVAVKKGYKVYLFNA